MTAPKRAKYDTAAATEKDVRTQSPSHGSNLAEPRPPVCPRRHKAEPPIMAVVGAGGDRGRNRRIAPKTDADDTARATTGAAADRRRRAGILRAMASRRGDGRTIPGRMLIIRDADRLDAEAERHERYRKVIRGELNHSLVHLETVRAEIGSGLDRVKAAIAGIDENWVAPPAGGKRRDSPKWRQPGGDHAPGGPKPPTPRPGVTGGALAPAAVRDNARDNGAIGSTPQRMLDALAFRPFAFGCPSACETPRYCLPGCARGRAP